MCLLKVESESSIRLFRHQVFKLTSIKGRVKYNLWNTCFLTQCTRWQRRWSLSASSSWRPGELWKDMAIKCFAWTGVKTRGELWARPRYKNKSSSIALSHTVWINGFYTLCSALLGPTGSHLGFLLHRKCCYQQNNCCGLTANLRAIHDPSIVSANKKTHYMTVLLCFQNIYTLCTLFVLQDGKVIVWDAFTTNKVHELHWVFKLINNNTYFFYIREGLI